MIKNLLASAILRLEKLLRYVRLVVILRDVKAHTFPIELQVEHLRIQLNSDNRWMNSDPTVKALTDRYLTMLADDWYAISHTPTPTFRTELGLDPNYSKPKSD